MTNFWAAGDLDGMLAACKPRCEVGALARNRPARDRKMAERIDAQLRDQKRPFVAVGSKHLTGLRQFLEERGYWVERVKFE